jgi:hypothetical protein
MNPQAMAQQPFFYYNPEQTNDHRQQAMFSPHPGAVLASVPPQHFAQHMYAHERPASAGYMHAYPFPFQTPIASPRPMYQPKAGMYMADNRALALDTDCHPDMYPATPPLSVGSAVSSPPTTGGVLPTPTGAVFFGDHLAGVKEGCEGEVKSEILAGENWTRQGSPPLTPGTFISLTRWIDV